MENKEIKNGINDIKNIVMTQSEKDLMLENIFKNQENNKSIKSPWSFYSFSLLVTQNRLVYYIIIPLIFILSGVGVVSASEDSLPNSLLYPLKVKVIEPVTGALSLSSVNKAKYESKLAKKRLVEAETLVKSGKLNNSSEQKINTLLASHTVSLNKALKKANNNPTSSEFTDDISTDFRAQMNAHAKVLDILNDKKEKESENNENDENKDREKRKEDDIKISNTARISADKIKNNTSKSRKESLKKYKDKKKKIESLIEDADKNINSNTVLEIATEGAVVEPSVDIDVEKTIEQAKAYLYDADKKDQEGDEQEAYSALLDSESSVKEANILLENQLNNIEKNTDDNDD